MHHGNVSLEIAAGLAALRKRISDHFPVWVQIKTDIDGERFNQIVQNNKSVDPMTAALKTEQRGRRICAYQQLKLQVLQRPHA
jgi:hypothetical protein